jgi:4-hydroxy-4-methyl-2-oxoglutarate aldolase
MGLPHCVARAHGPRVVATCAACYSAAAMEIIRVGEGKMRRICSVATFICWLLATAIPARAQLGLFSRDQRIAFSPDWRGERFPDGRPKVPDFVLEHLRNVTAEQAWDVLQDAGFRNQFEGGWKVINPGPRLVGRVVTAVFMPRRPDVDAMIQANGKKEGRIGDENSWIIDILEPGDILVVDLFGKIEEGTIVGDNLSTAIYAKSRNGLVVDGAVRDVSGIQEIGGFQVYARGFDPSALENVMLVGINVPIRIGHATVMPGDVVMGDPEGVTFIPPHLAEKVADDAETDRLIDEWGHMMLREGKYTPGQIDSKWTEEMVQAFNQWAQNKGSKVRLPEK